MGKRGPTPKPDAIKKQQGTFRSDRPNEAQQWHALDGIPEPPAYLPQRIANRFRTIVDELATVDGLLKLPDVHLIAQLAINIDLVATALADIEANGLTQANMQGLESARPCVKLLKEASEQVKKLAAEFGLSPAARTRIALDPPEDDDDPLLSFRKAQQAAAAAAAKQA